MDTDNNRFLWWTAGDGVDMLDMDPDILKGVITKLLAEVNLDMQSMEENDRGDVVTKSSDRVGRNVISLVRIKTQVESVEGEEIGDLYEDMLRIRARNAIFIVTSFFTKDAKKFAEELPMRLVDGKEFNDLIEPIIEIRSAFDTEKTESEVVRYFEEIRRKKTLGLFGSEEAIDEIDKRYSPIGCFVIKKIRGDEEGNRHAYIDLHTGELYHLSEGKIRRSYLIKDILELPEESRKHLMDLTAHGDLKRQYMDGIHLSILKKKGLASTYDKGKGNLIASVSDELSNTVSILSTEVYESESMKAAKITPVEAGAVNTKQYARSDMIVPPFDVPYDLGHFMKVTTALPDYEQDSVNYSTDDILDILKNLTQEDVVLEDTIYMPYYRCRYILPNKITRYKRLFAPKFKSFIPRVGAGNYSTFVFIDKYPEIPYLIFAIIFAYINRSEIEGVAHVLSSAFIFMGVLVFVGTLLKVIFRTERLVPYYGSSIFRYGFPSIHSMGSIGAISFILFVNWTFALVLIPVGLIYIISRVKLGAHSETDILGGAIVGFVLGWLGGVFILQTKLPFEIEAVIAVLFFIVPLVGGYVRRKYMH